MITLLLLTVPPSLQPQYLLHKRNRHSMMLTQGRCVELFWDRVDVLKSTRNVFHDELQDFRGYLHLIV